MDPPDGSRYRQVDPPDDSSVQTGGSRETEQMDDRCLDRGFVMMEEAVRCKCESRSKKLQVEGVSFGKFEARMPAL